MKRRDWSQGKKSDLRLGSSLEVRLVKLGGRSLEVKSACWEETRRMKVKLNVVRVREEMAWWAKVNLNLRVTSHGHLQHGRLIQVSSI